MQSTACLEALFGPRVLLARATQGVPQVLAAADARFGCFPHGFATLLHRGTAATDALRILRRQGLPLGTLRQAGSSVRETVVESNAQTPSALSSAAPGFGPCPAAFLRARVFRASRSRSLEKVGTLRPTEPGVGVRVVQALPERVLAIQAAERVFRRIRPCVGPAYENGRSQSQKANFPERHVFFSFFRESSRPPLETATRPRARRAGPVGTAP